MGSDSGSSRSQVLSATVWLAAVGRRKALVLALVDSSSPVLTRFSSGSSLLQVLLATVWSVTVGPRTALVLVLFNSSDLVLLWFSSSGLAAGALMTALVLVLFDSSDRVLLWFFSGSQFLSTSGLVGDGRTEDGFSLVGDSLVGDGRTEDGFSSSSVLVLFDGLVGDGRTEDGFSLVGDGRTEDGFGIQFGVNHLGHFLLTNLLLDKLKQSPNARVITVSSMAHRWGEVDFQTLLQTRTLGTGSYSWQFFKAYCNSKLCNILFTRELSRRLQGSSVSCFCLHPGVIRTELARNISLWQKFLVEPVSRLFFLSPEEGAQTTLHCALQEGLESLSGSYFCCCGEQEPSANAKDAQTARRLWEESERFCGLTRDQRLQHAAAPGAAAEDTEADVSEADLDPDQDQDLDQEQKQEKGPGAADAPETNGSVMLKIPQGRGAAGAGALHPALNKEQLLRVAGTPGWIRIRWSLLVLFWLAWLGMLVGAVLLILKAPPCKELPALNWWNEGPLFQIRRIQDFSPSGNIRGVEQQLDSLLQMKVRSLVLGPVHEAPKDDVMALSFEEVSPELGSLDQMKSLLKTAHEKGVFVVLDLSPNYSGSSGPWFSNSSVSSVAECTDLKV
ncbi:hypothetical protein WMY93_009876 [Mugilogobius chulae]|uniref:Glycosyl hydrolase family 13 catalytic domain-containing protein n=1 Tax=Mugilogobius chulae TaxID=88201 RepID=A0AAW0P5G7_9GOBI